MAGIGKKENLKRLSSEEARKNGSKGGLASVQSRRRKKTMREALEQLLFHTKLNEQTKKMLEAEGVENADDFNHQMVITRSLIAKAESGDVQAYNAICAMIGEKPAEKMDLSGSTQNELVIRHITQSPDDVNFPSSESEVDAER
jgi:hypothetical protein